MSDRDRVWKWMTDAAARGAKVFETNRETEGYNQLIDDGLLLRLEAVDEGFRRFAFTPEGKRQAQAAMQADAV